jgi:hypothetical protein
MSKRFRNKFERAVRPAHRPLNACDARLPVDDPHERRLCRAACHWSERVCDELLDLRRLAQAEAG